MWAHYHYSAEFSTSNIEQDLNRLLKEGSAASLPSFDQKLAMAATSALITYLGLLANLDLEQEEEEEELDEEGNPKPKKGGPYKLVQHDLSQYMRLDASALRALNLVPGTAQEAKNMTLFGVLNRCKTAQGVRLLGQWLKQPLVNLHEISTSSIRVNRVGKHTRLTYALCAFRRTPAKRQDLVETMVNDNNSRAILRVRSFLHFTLTYTETHPLSG